MLGDKDEDVIEMKKSGNDRDNDEVESGRDEEVIEMKNWLKAIEMKKKLETTMMETLEATVMNN